MQYQDLITSINKVDTSSDGVSQKNFTKQWNLSKFNKVISGELTQTKLEQQTQQSIEYPYVWVSQNDATILTLPSIFELSKSANNDLKEKVALFLNFLKGKIVEHWYVLNLRESEIYPSLNDNDDEIFLEWIFEHYRIGINLSDNSENDYWYLVSDKETGNIIAKGLIIQKQYENLISWMFGFIENYIAL